MKLRLMIWWKKGRLMMLTFVFMVLICLALLGAVCCMFVLAWDIIEDTELGRFIIMKIKNKYSG